MKNWTGFWGMLGLCFLAAGCSGDDGTQKGASAGDSGASSGGAGASMGGNAAPGGADPAGAGGADALVTESMLPDYGEPQRQADLPTTPVIDCTGQPDMTLCSVETIPDRSYDICIAGACVSPGCGDDSCNASMPHFRIPPTSNHQYFERTSDAESLVADLITGLEWQGCNAGLSGADCSSGTALEMAWDEALAYCDGLSWGGHEDWYLPDLFEGMSILDYRAPGELALDPGFFPATAIYFWTSQYEAGSSAYQLQIHQGLAAGTVRDEPMVRLTEVRCVRRAASGAGATADGRFEESTVGDRTVQDTVTGMIWQGCRVGQRGEDCDGEASKLSSAEFLAYCSNLEYAGHADWRLPTFKEAQSGLTIGSNPTFADEIFHFLGSSNYLGSWYGAEDQVPVLLSTWDANRTGPSSKGAYDVLCVRDE